MHGWLINYVWNTRSRSRNVAVPSGGWNTKRLSFEIWFIIQLCKSVYFKKSMVESCWWYWANKRNEIYYHLLNVGLAGNTVCTAFQHSLLLFSFYSALLQSNYSTHCSNLVTDHGIFCYLVSTVRIIFFEKWKWITIN